MMEPEQFDCTVSEFAQAVSLLVRRLRAANPTSDLTLTQRAVIARLAVDGPASISDLARAECMKPQSMSTTVAALEEMAMVERQPDPEDGRQFLIRLTALGALVREQNRAAKRTWLAEAIAQLDHRDQETLFAAAEIIKRLGGK